MKDRKRIKNNGMGQLMIDIKPNRCDSDVFVNQTIDVTNLVKYLEEEKEKGNNITYFHAIVCAVAKLFYNRKRLNYFVANRHLYEHTSIDISFVAKVEFEDSSEEIMIIIPINEDDNIHTISNKVKEKVKNIREHKVDKKGANSAIDTLGKLPNIIRVPLVGFLKIIDDKGLLPASLKEDNLYYSSIILTDVGTFKFNAIYHNITNFGTCSSIASIGEIKTNGKISTCDFGINFDERVADGFYFIKSLKMLEYILANPDLLEEKVSTKVELK